MIMTTAHSLCDSRASFLYDARSFSYFIILQHTVILLLLVDVYLFGIVQL